MEIDNGQQGHWLSLVNVDIYAANLVAAKGVLLQGSAGASPRWPFTPKARAKLQEAQEVHRQKKSREGAGGGEGCGGGGGGGGVVV